MSVTDTDLQLERWGRWVRTSSGTPKCNGIMGRIADMAGGVVGEEPMQDEQAMLIDRLVGMVGNRKSQMHKRALIGWYINEYETLRALGKSLGVSKDKAGQLKNEAVAWIDGALAGQEAMTA